MIAGHQNKTDVDPKNALETELWLSQCRSSGLFPNAYGQREFDLSVGDRKFNRVLVTPRQN